MTANYMGQPHSPSHSSLNNLQQNSRPGQYSHGTNGSSIKNANLALPVQHQGDHMRQPSDSGYSFLDYYANSITSPDNKSRKSPVKEFHDDMNLMNQPDGNDNSNTILFQNQTSNNLDEGETVEGFTIVPTPNEVLSSNQVPLNTSRVSKRYTAVPTMSTESLQESKESSDELRSKIGRTISSTTVSHDNKRRSSTNINTSNNTHNIHNQNGPGVRTHRRGMSSSSILQSDRDRYGFKKSNNYITRKEYDTWWADYSKFLIKRKKKWEKFMTKNGFNVSEQGSSPTRFPAKSEDLRKMVRKGIPAEWRGNAWFYFAKGHDKLRNNKGLYDELTIKTLNSQNNDTEAIEKDLHRTFPENIHFANIHSTDPVTNKEIVDESPFLKSLRRVLRCFAEYKPLIGYCQSMNFIAGLLLIFMEEEKAFWMLVIITDKFFPGIHDLTLEGLSVHQGVLLLCLREYIPEIWNILLPSPSQTKADKFIYDLPPISLSTTHWFMSIFVGVLPIETTLRVWDCLFYEDSKSIFQVSLTIFNILKPQIAQVVEKTALNVEKYKKKKLKFSLDNNGTDDFNGMDIDEIDEDERDFLNAEIFQIVQNGPKHILDVNTLLEDCFRYSNFHKLSQEEIVKCKKYVEETRSRYNELIEKRSKTISEDDRSRLLKDAEYALGNQMNKPNGLKTMDWNSKLNTRLRRIQKKLR